MMTEGGRFRRFRVSGDCLWRCDPAFDLKRSRDPKRAGGPTGLRGVQMPVRVRAIRLWRTEVEDRPGVLAQTLEPLAMAGADLQVVMGYRWPGDRARAAIEIFPVIGARALSAAQAAGLT